MSSNTSPLGRRAGLVLLAVTCLASCANDDSGARTIGAPRTVESLDGGIRWNATAQERFRIPSPAATAAARAPTAGAGEHAGADAIHWRTPAGWREVETTAMRQANFRIGDDGTECYLTILAGDGGGLAANVNRWRRQMSLPASSPEEIAALPRANFFGGEALFVDLEGTYTGMGGDEAAAQRRMLALAQVDGGAARFLKLIGPKSTVDAQFEAFKALAVSFHAGHGDAAADPHADLEAAAPAAAVAAEASSSGRGLRWENPGGWRIGPERPMRAVTFAVDETTECYVVVLSGEGGGLAANVNRWRTQMSAADLSEDELAELPRVPMLDTEGVLVEIPGTYTGSDDGELAQGLLLGAVCMLPQSSVFVKMVGPAATVEAHRETFEEFCRSMEVLH